MKFYAQLFLLSLFSIYATQTVANSNTEYKLSSGDIISITVYAEPDLSLESIKLNETGSISYPFIGEIKAEGLSAPELQAYITKTLSGDYLVNPKVSVSILEYRQFYISGEVKKPAGYPFQPGLTIRRAIALAGGLTERASERRITLVRETDVNKTPKSVNLDSLVMPGDSIAIGQGFF